MKSGATALIVAATLLAARVQSQVSPDQMSAQVDALFGYLNKSPSPGVAIVVVRDSKVICEKGFGMASLEHKVPITPSTLFHLGSCGKQFTGLAIAELITQGKIRLEDDIRKYIPEMADFGHPMTIEQLLRHTSGLRDWTAPLSLTGWRFDDVVEQPEILRFAFGQRTLNFVPGSRELYSNTGYGLLALLLRRVTGKSIRSWSEENIFRPLGMTSSLIRDDHAQVLPNVAYGYLGDGNGGYRRQVDNMISLGSSSVWSTADDMAKWMMNFDTGAVGGKAAIELMQTPGALNDGTKVNYGFGLAYGSERGHPVLNHQGSWAGVNAFIAYFPKDRIGVAALTNGPIPNVFPSAYGLALWLLGIDAPPKPPSSAPQPSEPKTPSKPLDELIGLYRFESGEFLRIGRVGDVLTSQVTREGLVDLGPGKKKEHWIGRGSPIIFIRDADSKVIALELEGKRAKRVSENENHPSAQLHDYEGVYESTELDTFYRVVINKNGVLEMRHGRRGALPLTWLWPDEFGGADDFIQSVKFERDGKNSVKSLVINGSSRALDIVFQKLQ